MGLQSLLLLGTGLASCLGLAIGSASTALDALLLWTFGGRAHGLRCRRAICTGRRWVGV